MSSLSDAYPRLLMPCLPMLSMSSLGLDHYDLVVSLPFACFCFPKTSTSLVSLTYSLLTFVSGVGALSFDGVKYVANIVLNSSLLTLRQAFKIIQKSINRFVNSLSSFFETHHRLMARHAGSKSIKQYLKDLICGITLLLLLCYHAL